jgi:formylglycine-generating enzyme required for sulfatase activity
MKKILLATAILAGASLATSAHADTFGTGTNQFTLDFTTIGNTNNSADTNGYGSVGYAYRIGTYEISQNQIDKATASGLSNVVAGAFSGDQPAGRMNWFESAAFVNWLNTSKGFAPAYNLSWSGSTWSMALWTVGNAGYDANNKYRNSLAKYFLPSENEFYKAAFGKSDGTGYYLYPTASNSAPTAVTSGTTSGTAVYNNPNWIPPGPASIYQAGGRSSYGTMGQGGNMQEWQESSLDGTNDKVGDQRMVRGGYWHINGQPLDSSTRSSYEPGTVRDNLGFRVASVDVIPEPSTYALIGLGALALVIAYRRKTA